MKLSIVSHTYPTKLDPSSGIFIQREAHLIQEFANVSMHIPAVYATFLNKQYYRSYEPQESVIPVRQFKYLSFPRKKFPSLTRKSLSKRLCQSISEYEPDIVHLHWLYPIGLAAPSIKKEGYPLVLTLHGSGWYEGLRNAALLRLFKETLSVCDAVITVGSQLKEDVLKVLPEIKERTHHIPHGINTTKFAPAPSKKQAKENFGWQNHLFNILCVANLYRVKGVHLLIQAFGRNEYLEDSHLHIVAPRFDKDVKEEISQLILKLDLQNHVTFYPSMPEEEIIKFYQAADMFVSPSLREGFGLAVAEAAACGTPVLATRSGGPEQIITPKTGQLVEANNIEALTNGIERMLPQLNIYNREEMHSIMQESFSLQSKKHKLLEVYNSILKR